MNLINNIEDPQVSVVLVTYNQEKYVAKAIESILSQKTNFVYELVIGEDCSTDRTRDICIEYSQKHGDKIRLLLQKHNVGIQKNFCETIHSTRGKYIALCDGDDYWIDPKKLQTQYETLEIHPEYSGIHARVNYVDKDGFKIGVSDLMPENSDIISFDYLVQKNVIHTCSFMCRRSILDENVYAVLSLSPVPDYALFLVTALASDIFYIDKTLSAYRKNFGITSSWKHINYIKCRLDIYRLLKKHFDIKRHKPAILRAKQFQYFHLLSVPRKGWGNFKKLWYVMPLLYYTVLSSVLRSDVNVHGISVFDVIKVIFRSRFRLKNWRQYMGLESLIGTR